VPLSEILNYALVGVIVFLILFMMPAHMFLVGYYDENRSRDYYTGWRRNVYNRGFTVRARADSRDAGAAVVAAKRRRAGR
jgi:hypothetical protein